MRNKTPALPVTAALNRRGYFARPRPKPVKPKLKPEGPVEHKPKSRTRITDEDAETPIATLELHGLSTSIINVLEKFGNVTYLGEVKRWTDADFCRVRCIGKTATAKFRAALTRYLRGSRPMPEFNTVNSDSTAAVRDEYWYPVSPDVKDILQAPWTIDEYRSRKSGLLPDTDRNPEGAVLPPLGGSLPLMIPGAGGVA